ncbi:hypothetical protein HETIRDRAFT_308579 [Heterobasidion irregulare TC 32-1]|uniref:Secreted protein n=1 Tax=Heterobasidion irregulare (strain TC 32-1) TaxID=747525 RepID=W4KJ62_HETIT|nr:uncharacterized protein HETIRDRAFT_308579 [Heterobasidion irregulare TC 32-1]ETW85106.1 hypothetical protein HETIRDRAFT_308579 [Heterobasidion irregulare TC 32-1]
MSYLLFSFLIILCSLNTCGLRAILSSDSYPLDHSPVVIELLFGTLSVPVASLSLRSTTIPCVLDTSFSTPALEAVLVLCSALRVTSSISPELIISPPHSPLPLIHKECEGVIFPDRELYLTAPVAYLMGLIEGLPSTKFVLGPT